jgi:hypothetical protein
MWTGLKQCAPTLLQLTLGSCLTYKFPGWGHDLKSTAQPALNSKLEAVNSNPSTTPSQITHTRFQAWFPGPCLEILRFGVGHQ